MYICVNYNDLTTTSLEIMVSKGNHPQMAELFRLVKYYNLPIYIHETIMERLEEPTQRLHQMIRNLARYFLLRTRPEIFRFFSLHHLFI